MSKKLKVALAGLGSRGKDTYALTAKLFPEKIEIVAIADIDPAKVEDVAREYNIPKRACFYSAEELIAQDKAIICYWKSQFHQTLMSVGKL